MCSKSTDNDNSPGSYIYKRVKQLKKLLTEINEIGVNPNNIFISGWSAGGWTALHMFRENEKLFNSAIVLLRHLLDQDMKQKNIRGGERRQDLRI